MIIVMPNADSSWYINSYDGKEKYEDFFYQGIYAAYEKAYRIKTDKKYRGIAGFIYGWLWCYVYAIKIPQLFFGSCPLSAAVFPDDQMVDMPDNNWEMYLDNYMAADLKARIAWTRHGRPIPFWVSAG